ncbi:hypothetical protein C9374_008709 [Naegleria lovaniensis]|uniref:PH domain-containing protein n=1 Tax=Naegleria lovaniensis TaxID=51637 RepID=A0AA88KF72_NAELO|nr:uncharacterized protein C9374_008709 [Naegleria lovaniensis]KAG2378087.1 hypothetical protein C9374_008709 [Naegleria lovaniensis]
MRLGGFGGSTKKSSASSNNSSPSSSSVSSNDGSLGKASPSRITGFNLFKKRNTNGSSNNLLATSVSSSSPPPPLSSSLGIPEKKQVSSGSMVSSASTATTSLSNTVVSSKTKLSDINVEEEDGDEDLNKLDRNSTFKLTDDSLLLPSLSEGVEYDENYLLHRGFLVKEGANVHNWKRRYFKLFTTRLEYYKSENDSKPINQIPITSSTQVGEAPEKHLQKQHTFKIINQDRVLFVSAANRDQMLDWIKKIKQAVASSHLVSSTSKTLQRKQTHGNYKDFLLSTFSEKRRGKLRSHNALSTMPFEQLSSTFSLNEKEKKKTIESFCKTFFESGREIDIIGGSFRINFAKYYSTLRKLLNSSTFPIDSFEFVLTGVCQYEKPQPFIGGFPIYLKGSFFIIVSPSNDIKWVGFSSVILNNSTMILFSLGDVDRVFFRASQHGKEESYHLSFEFNSLQQVQRRTSIFSSSNNSINKLDFRFSDRHIWSYIVFELAKYKFFPVIEGDMMDTIEEDVSTPVTPQERSRSKSVASMSQLQDPLLKQPQESTEMKIENSPTPSQGNSQSAAFESDDEQDEDKSESIHETESRKENETAQIEEEDEPLTEKDDSDNIDNDLTNVETLTEMIPPASEITFPKRKKKKENQYVDIHHHIRQLEEHAQDEFISLFSNLYYNQFSEMNKTMTQGQIVFADERVVDKIFSTYLKQKDSLVTYSGMLYLTNNFLWFDSIDMRYHALRPYQWMIHLGDIFSIQVNISLYIIRLSLGKNHNLYISLDGEDDFESFKTDIGFNDLITLDINNITSLREKRFLSSLRIVYCLVKKIQFAYNLDRQVFHHDEHFESILRNEDNADDDHLTSEASNTNSDTSVELTILNVGSVRESMINNYFEQQRQDATPTTLNNTTDTDFDDTTYDAVNDDDDNHDEYFDLQTFEVELVQKFKNKKVKVIAKQNVVDDSKVIEIKDLKKDKAITEIPIDENTNVALSGKNVFSLSFQSKKKKKTEVMKFECKTVEASFVVNYFTDFMLSGSVDE